METTPISVLALAPGRKEEVEYSILFMINKQEVNGSWEIGIPAILEERFFPSVTGFVLSTLMCMNVSDNIIPRGIEYILKTQHEDGSWGSSPTYYDTPYYATYANLLALRLYGLEESDNYKSAVSYIKQNQNQDGSWGADYPDRPSRALRTALALNSILISPTESDSESIEHGVKWLINNQESDGSWKGGYFVNFGGKKEDIFATAMAILALKRYERYKYYKNNDSETLLCLN